MPPIVPSAISVFALERVIQAVHFSPQGVWIQPFYQQPDRLVKYQYCKCRLHLRAPIIRTGNRLHGFQPAEPELTLLFLQKNKPSHATTLAKIPTGFESVFI